MALAALAILGHRSAHSFPIGPVMAEPEQKHAYSYVRFFLKFYQKGWKIDNC